MSRGWGGPGGQDGLAYGELPQRWDRDRFERFGGGGRGGGGYGPGGYGGGGGPPQRYQEDYRFQERDRPGRQDIAVQDRIQTAGPRGGYEERDRFYEQDRQRYTPGGRPRRTDKELFGDVDPREFANMAITPYRRKSVTREDYEYDRRPAPPPPRPGLIRRQSSLDTFDRRPIPRYEREEYRIPSYSQATVPYRGGDRWGREEEFEEFTRGRDYDEPEEYKEVEIRRERSVRRRRPSREARSEVKSVKSGKSSKAKSVTTKQSSSSSSSSETIQEEASVHESRGGGRSLSFHESVHESRGGESFNESESVHESVHPSRAGTRFEETKSVRESVAPSRGGSFHEVKNIRESFGGGRPPSIHESIHQDGHTIGGESFHESFHESEHGGATSISESIQETNRKFKKGKTRMPKRLVRREAIMDLGYPFEEEEDFYVLRIALEKEQIDEVIRISETYKNGEKKTVYKFDEKVEEETGGDEREEIYRTEWINPPTVIGGGRDRDSRAPPSIPPAPDMYEERSERKTVVEDREGSRVRSSSHGGALVVQEREHRSDRDIKDEIRRLEAERRALRFEREAEDRQDRALRIREGAEEDYSLTKYRSKSRSGRDRDREYLEVVDLDRNRSPDRNVTRVEKDRKARRRSRAIAAAIGTLS